MDAPRPYPIEVFSPTLRSTAEALVNGMQASPAIIGQSLLAAAALVTQSLADVEIDGRSIPLSIFAITIADSGERKSAVDRIVLSEIRKRESQRHMEYRIKMKLWRAAQQRQKPVSENSKKHPQTKGSQAVEDAEPAPGIILIEEPTFEGIFKFFAKGAHFLGLFSDEGGRLTGGYAMNSENRGKTVSGFSELWDAKPLTRARSGDEFDRIEGKRLSIHLMMQPIVAQGLVSDKLMIGQGFIARTLLVKPAPLAGTRTYRHFNPAESREIILFHDKMREKLDFDLPLSKDTLAVLRPRIVKLSPEAFEQYKLYHDDIEVECGPAGRYLDIKATASKSAEHAIRIAGVLELFENPRSEIISLTSMSAGVSLSRYYLEEQLRIHEGMKIPLDIEKSIRALKFIQRRKFERIKLKDLYQQGPRDIRTSAEAAAVAAILQDHGWLRPKGLRCWEVVPSPKIDT
jgi:hypothetical protein